MQAIPYSIANFLKKSYKPKQISATEKQKKPLENRSTYGVKNSGLRG